MLSHTQESSPRGDSVDQAEPRWGDLREKDRSREVGRLDSGFIEPAVGRVMDDSATAAREKSIFT